MNGDLPKWIQETKMAGVFRVSIYVQPGSRQSGVVGEFDGCLKVKISSLPVEGAANEALCEWIAQKLGAKARNVVLVQGQTSRRKVFEVSGVTGQDIYQKLLV